MCFSASASFSAGAALLIICYLAIRQTKHHKQLPVALVPGGFGLQQLAEGFVWLGLSNPSFAWATTPATYVFLFFAFIWWPIWIPYALCEMEQNEENQWMLRWATALGTGTALALAFCVIAYGAPASIVGSHIFYDTNVPRAVSIAGTLAYLMATVGSFFLSTIRYMWVMGLLTGLSYILAYFAYSQCQVSVWCFFAAIISMMLIIINPFKK